MYEKYRKEGPVAHWGAAQTKLCETYVVVKEVPIATNHCSLLMCSARTKSTEGVNNTRA